MTTLDPNTRTERDENKPLARFDDEHNVLWLGELPIPFRRGEHTNADLLGGLASCIREMRGLPEGAPCPLRDRELATFAGLLNLQHRALRRDVRRQLVLDKAQAGILVARLRRLHREAEAAA